MNYGWLCAIMATSTVLAGPSRKVGYEPNGKPARSGATAVAAANVFLNAKTTAKGQWSTSAPNLAVDGKRSDSAQHWGCEGIPVWHQLDLGKNTTIAQLVVVPYWSDGRIYQFKVEGSTDGETWTMLADQTANSINTGATGFRLDIDPVDIRYVRTTFTNNSAGNASGGHLVEIEGYAAKQSDSSVGVGEIYTRYDRDVMTTTPLGKTVVMEGWRGERVNAVLVANSADGFKELTVLPHPFIKVDVLRYTLGDGILYADIVDGLTQTSFKGVTRPLLLTWNVPRDGKIPAVIPPVSVMVNGTRHDIPVKLTAEAMTLPEPKDWRVHLDIWQHPDAIARWHDVPMWSDIHLELLKDYGKILADMGQKVITTTLINEGWGGQTYDKFTSMVKITLKADGTWAYDYTAFDKYVSLMIECGIDEQISCYTMVPWSLTFSYYDEAKHVTVNKRMNPSSKEYADFWGPYLQDLDKHVTAKGWRDMTKIAMDERPDHLIKPALALVEKYTPFGIVAACNGPSQINEAFYDVSYSYSISGSVAAVAEARRAEGKKTTYYVCVSPTRPNTFMWSDPAEAEWLGAMAANVKFDGILRWALTSWVENPFISQDFTSWPTGDTSLIYPSAKISMRLVHFRNGLETFEKIHIMKENKTWTPELEAKLNVFTVGRGHQKGVHAGDVKALGL